MQHKNKKIHKNSIYHFLYIEYQNVCFVYRQSKQHNSFTLFSDNSFAFAYSSVLFYAVLILRPKIKQLK
jgi:hypothetical protein